VETQLPALQASVVQLLLSVHVFVLSLAKRQPVVPFEPGEAGLHESSVQELESSQAALTGVETQDPALQASVVQLLLSVQECVLSLVKRQPVAPFAPGAAGLQASSVQALPSLQLALTLVEMQEPAVHASVVQVLPSVQVFVLSFANTHPVVPSEDGEDG